MWSNQDELANQPLTANTVGAAELLSQARQRDLIGHHVHVALGILYAMLLPLATAPKDIVWTLLVIWCVVRLPHTRVCYAPILRLRLVWLFLAWAGWHGLCCLWSSDPVAGLDEFGAFRVVVTPLVLWPVIDRAGWLIGAFLIGLFGQNIVQLCQQFHWLGQEPGFAGRLDGWLHAIHTGAFCAAAMCWTLAAVLNGRGKLRWLSLVGMAVAAVGLVYTGSRGPWIAAAIVLPLGLVLIGIRRRSARRAAVGLAAISLIGAAVAWPLAKDVVVPRIRDALGELRQAREEGVYWTSAGLRPALWSWAWQMFEAAPLRGVGAGGFHDALQQQPSYKEAIARQPDRAEYMARDHAHSTSMQVLATTGLPGAVLLVTVLALAVRQAWRDPPWHPFSDGTLLVILSWVIGAQFDTYHLNGHLFGLLALALAVSARGSMRQG